MERNYLVNGIVVVVSNDDTNAYYVAVLPHGQLTLRLRADVALANRIALVNRFNESLRQMEHN